MVSLQPVRVLCVLLLALALVAGCSREDEQNPVEDAASEDVRDLAAAPSAAAVLDPERGDPPAALRIEDLVTGSGDPVRTGDEVTVEHLGLRWSDGQEISSSWMAGEPLRFTLGEGRVIPGWELGLLGEDTELGPLRVGGRRVLTVPPDLAYAAGGAGSEVGADETLVFVIDLIAIGDPGPDPGAPR